MNTSIRKGKTMFYGDNTFPQGISRSGYFNKRESDELIQYGATLEALCNGDLTPKNEEEKQFVNDMESSSESDLYSVRLWKKYISAVEKSRIRHGFSNCNGRVREHSVNEYSFA